MNRIATLTTAVALTATTGLFGWQALAQNSGNQRGQDSSMMDMSGMGMSNGMQMCMKMNMQTELAPEDPSALLALREDLSLTEEQAQQLEDLVEQTRQAAADILTDGQREQLEALPDQPRTMMEMHRQMMQSMKEQSGPNCAMCGGAASADTMQCPMMGMMDESEKQDAG